MEGKINCVNFVEYKLYKTLSWGYLGFDYNLFVSHSNE